MIVYTPRAALARLVLPTFAAGSDVSVVIKPAICFVLYRQTLLSGIHHAYQVIILLAVETQTGSGCLVLSRTVLSRTAQWNEPLMSKPGWQLHCWVSVGSERVCSGRVG